MENDWFQGMQFFVKSTPETSLRFTFEYSLPLTHFLNCVSVLYYYLMPILIFFSQIHDNPSHIINFVGFRCEQFMLFQMFKVETKQLK